MLKYLLFRIKLFFRIVRIDISLIPKSEFYCYDVTEWKELGRPIGNDPRFQLTHTPQKYYYCPYHFRGNHGKWEGYEACGLRSINETFAEYMGPDDSCKECGYPEWEEIREG